MNNGRRPVGVAPSKQVMLKLARECACRVLEKGFFWRVTNSFQISASLKQTGWRQIRANKKRLIISNVIVTSILVCEPLSAIKSCHAPNVRPPQKTNKPRETETQTLPSPSPDVARRLFHHGNTLVPIIPRAGDEVTLARYHCHRLGI